MQKAASIINLGKMLAAFQVSIADLQPSESSCLIGCSTPWQLKGREQTAKRCVVPLYGLRPLERERFGSREVHTDSCLAKDAKESSATARLSLREQEVVLELFVALEPGSLEASEWSQLKVLRTESSVPKQCCTAAVRYIVGQRMRLLRTVNCRRCTSWLLLGIEPGQTWPSESFR